MGFSLSGGFSDPNVAMGTGFFGDVFDLSGKRAEEAEKRALQPLRDFEFTDFSAGGLTGTTKDGVFTLSRGEDLQGTIGGLQSALTARAMEFANLRKGLNRDIAPLIGGLRKAGTEAIQGRRRRSIGDLRENLKSRRIAGSSFAADAITRAEAEFAKEEAEFGAQIGEKEFQLQQELLATDMSLLDQETKANIESFNVNLNQLNLESALGAEISMGMNEISAANARMIADIIAQFHGARENKLGTGAGILASFFGGG